MRFLYKHSDIDKRYSVIPDFSAKPGARKLFPESVDLEPFPLLEERMRVYDSAACKLASETVLKCIEGKIDLSEITHLITVSCTGMSAPGLDLQVMEALQLPGTTVRTSVNFMGCYAAIHGLKLADAFCKSSSNANVVVVCLEFCTLHFQKEATIDNLTSSVLFADGCAAALVQSDTIEKGISIDQFYADVAFKGKKDMAWQMASTGFQMTLTGYVPDLIKEDFKSFVQKALQHSHKNIEDVDEWCIHPGGKKILESIACSLGISRENLCNSFEVLRQYGNMSSPTILFVLKDIMHRLSLTPSSNKQLVFAAAFGPGLTMETFTGYYA
jgi:predicted naringenin-chalcone synthase